MIRNWLRHFITQAMKTALHEITESAVLGSMTGNHDLIE